MIYKRLILLLITQIMENKQALKLIEKIQKDLLQNKFEVSKIVEELKKIREISLELNNPVVTKALRFPDDEPVDSKEGTVETSISEENNIESFNYFLSLFTDLTKKNNVLDLKEYNKAFLAY
jgi:hypothetical protein